MLHSCIGGRSCEAACTEPKIKHSKRWRFVLKILVMIVGAIMFFSHTSSSFAQDMLLDSSDAARMEYALPFPGILPDHPLYIIKRIRDGLLLFFTHDPLKKSNLHLLFADKKVAMTKLLWEKKNYDLSIETAVEAENHLVASCAALSELKETNRIPLGAAEKISQAAKKHSDLIGLFRLSVSDTQYDQSLQQTTVITNQAEQCVSSLK